MDLWSCGVILFALICGYLPFEDPNTANLYKKILSGDFGIPKHVSSDAKDLLRKVLNTDPTKRFNSKDIKAHPWFNMRQLGDEPAGIIIGYNEIPVN